MNVSLSYSDQHEDSEYIAQLNQQNKTKELAEEFQRANKKKKKKCWVVSRTLTVKKKKNHQVKIEVFLSLPLFLEKLQVSRKVSIFKYIYNIL